MRDCENAPPDEQAFVVKELKLALLKINVEDDIFSRKKNNFTHYVLHPPFSL